jgi:hypothetical protein
MSQLVLESDVAGGWNQASMISNEDGTIWSPNRPFFNSTRPFSSWQWILLRFDSSSCIPYASHAVKIARTYSQEKYPFHEMRFKDVAPEWFAQHSSHDCADATKPTWWVNNQKHGHMCRNSSAVKHFHELVRVFDAKFDIFQSVMFMMTPIPSVHACSFSSMVFVT